MLQYNYAYWHSHLPYRLPVVIPLLVLELPRAYFARHTPTDTKQRRKEPDSASENLSALRAPGLLSH